MAIVPINIALAVTATPSHYTHVLHWYCAGTTLVLHWCSTQVPHWHCTGTTLAHCWLYPGAELVLDRACYWHGIGTTRVLLQQQCSTAGRFAANRPHLARIWRNIRVIGMCRDGPGYELSAFPGRWGPENRGRAKSATDFAKLRAHGRASKLSR